MLALAAIDRIISDLNLQPTKITDMINYAQIGSDLETSDAPTLARFVTEFGYSPDPHLRTLARFAGHLRKARAAREAGSIQRAMDHEEAADSVYDREIPEEYQW